MRTGVVVQPVAEERGQSPEIHGLGERCRWDSTHEQAQVLALACMGQPGLGYHQAG